MRPLIFNVLLFLFVYVPLTLIIGLVVDAFKVTGVDDNAGYEFFLWLVVTIQLVVPTIMLFTAIQLVIHVSIHESNTGQRRAAAIAMNGLLLPLLQGFLWTGTSLSLTWLAVAVVPALVLGCLAEFTIRAQ